MQLLRENIRSPLTEEMRTMIEQYNMISFYDITERTNMSIELMYQFRKDFLNQAIVIGASGSIFGILLAFGMMFPNVMIYVYFLFPIKAKWFVMLYGVIELYMGVKGTDNVAHYAHLGGMLFGYILIKWWQQERYPFGY
jgi:membrane associated rhomboid family serine protease